MTMTVELGSGLEAAVEALVKEGRYGSKSEVLRAGVRMVQEHEAHFASLIERLQAGLDDADAGRIASIEEVAADLRARSGPAE